MPSNSAKLIVNDPVIILLHSGGMDSEVCRLMRPDWHPVYVRHGAEQEMAELNALHDIRSLDSRFDFSVINTEKLHIEPDGHIDYRNALLLTTALAAYPHADGVAFGALLGEGSGDKSAAFARHLAKAWSISAGRPISLLRPLRRYTKAQALRHGLSLDVHGTLAVTTSCYHGNDCGRCQPCFRLGIAKYLNGLRDAPPPFPTETKGIAATLRANKLRRWPVLAAAQTDVIRAYGVHRARKIFG